MTDGRTVKYIRLLETARIMVNAWNETSEWDDVASWPSSIDSLTLSALVLTNFSVALAYVIHD